VINENKILILFKPKNINQIILFIYTHNNVAVNADIFKNIN
jgi:hypothetical protein